jgi:hypothetical protein
MVGSMPVNIRNIVENKAIFIKNKLPMDEPIRNNAFGCLFNVGILRKTKQLHKLPIVLEIIVNKPTITHKRFPILIIERKVSRSEDI